MNELNVVRKDFRKVELKLALCYPNIYQAGIACYAIQVLYSLFNSFENIQCERFYYSQNRPLLSIETEQLLDKFDMICFSLQYELDYINMLNMLFTAGIPLRSDKRKSHLVIAGGPCALENPLPLSSFVDIFVLGDLEPIVDQLVSYLIEYKKGTKGLSDFAEIPGLFIPQFHHEGTIPKLIAPDLDKCSHPTAQLISEASPFGKSLLLEVTRGCPRGCRFCLIGYQGLPMRSRSLSNLKEIISNGMEQSQVDKVTLIGPSVSDYPQLEELCEFIINRGLKVSLPSMRIDAVSGSLMELLKNSGLKTLTFAPESGSERLRTAIGKEISEEELIEKLILCSDAKIETIKLYFLINLPTETLEDIESIKILLDKIIQKAYLPQHLHLSINPFIPKPHTPFQWEPPPLLPTLQKITKNLQRGIRKLKIYNAGISDPRWARIQSCISRGNRDLGEILVAVLQNGGSLGAWRKVTKSLNYSIDTSQIFLPSLDEMLPWEFIDVHVDKKKILNLYHQTYG